MTRHDPTDPSRGTRTPPNLVKLVERYGTYADIPANAWALWDEEMKAFNTAVANDLPFEPVAEEAWPERPAVPPRAGQP